MSAPALDITERADTGFAALFGAGRGVPGAKRTGNAGASMPAQGPLPCLFEQKLKREHYKSGIRRQKVSTGVRDFDQQTTSIGSGNLVGGTCNCSYIRDEHDVRNAIGEVLPRGYLRDWDLDHYGIELPSSVREFVVKATEYGPVHLACLHHHDRRSDELLIHGFLVIDARDERLLRCFYGTAHPRSKRIVALCAPYLAVKP